jgi:hypothetical protein
MQNVLFEFMVAALTSQLPGAEKPEICGYF